MTDAPVGYPAREVALERILSQALRFPDLDVTPFDPRSFAGPTELEPRDAALARAIEHAVVRRYLTLVACLRPHLSKKWPLLEKPVQAALLGGAAQILFLDRVPAAAAVDASVEWTKRRLRPGAAGFVNAVLRRVAGSVVERVPPGAREGGPSDGGHRDLVPLADGGALRLSVECFHEDAATRLAERTSHARELVLHWIGAFGFHEATRLATHDLVEPPILVTPWSPSLAGPFEPHDEPGYGVFTGSHAELAALLAADPRLRVQDPTAGATVAALAAAPIPRPSLVVDLCAGRGTKTRQLAAAFPEAEILASDPDEARFAALGRVPEHFPNVRALRPEALLREGAGRADLVLIDVPCSNSGVLARRPEARYRFSRARTHGVAELQQRIGELGMGLLAPRGFLCYATCSIERYENESQSRRLAQRHGLSTAVERTILPAGLPGDPPRTYRDGGYHALLARA